MAGTGYGYPRASCLEMDVEMRAQIVCSPHSLRYNALGLSRKSALFVIVLGGRMPVDEDTGITYYCNRGVNQKLSECRLFFPLFALYRAKCGCADIL